jgi:hypothetical protein
MNSYESDKCGAVKGRRSSTTTLKPAANGAGCAQSQKAKIDLKPETS